MRITIHILAAIILLAIFACSESPNSSQVDYSSSSKVPSSSSNLSASSSENSSVSNGRACEYSGDEDFGINEILFCAEMPSNMPNLYAQRTLCEEEGGAWVNTSCPKGEKYTCIDEEEEDEYAKGILYKIYADGLTCSDLELKNVNGNGGVITKGGACGPFTPEPKIPLSVCVEFPELSAGFIKLACAELETAFAEECPRLSADLKCYDSEEEMIYYFYGEAVFSRTCKDFEMEDF
ncbi:MAG: hypothetical protein LBU89_08925 [Fibromonadaceae bacterium]|jgi:hypothetical protein|nr:hypothetical protein [Fibromonadaceae bacterium]